MARFEFLQFMSAAMITAALAALAHAGPPQPGGGTVNYLLIADWGRDTVRRYDGATGDFVDVFIPKHSGGLSQPWGTLFGPHDGNLYVSSGEFAGPGHIKAVLRYDGTTGAFIGEFAESGRLVSPRGIIFGQDGNLYVADHTSAGGRVVQFDGTTGAYIDDFVSIGSGGLHIPLGIVFGPSGTDPNLLDLYVVSLGTQSVLRYDGTTGTFLGEFVASGSGGLDGPGLLTFGPSGELFVSDFYSDDPAVFRYQGPSGPTPGAFIDQFVPPGSGGLQVPASLIFGPDGNGDEHVDLYVTSADVPGFNGKKASVKRYDGVTGAFIDTFVTQRSGRLDDPTGMTFTDTDPVTLNYLGGKAPHLAMHGVPEPPALALIALAALGAVLTRSRGKRRWAVAHRAPVATSFVLLVSASSASGAMFNANNVAELISAINSANQNAEPDSIALAAGTTFTLTLANISTNGPTGLPTISASESLSIFGYGSIIERSAAIETPGFRLFDVAAGASLSLQDLTLQRGLAFGRDFAALGGAILNQGTLALQNVVVQNNNAVGRGSSSNQFSGPQPADRGMGGGIFSSGSLTIEGGAIHNNLAQGGNGAQSISAFGGGTFPSLSGAAGLGGGLYIGAGFAHLRNVTVVNNTAQGGRGGNGHATHGPYGGADGGGGYGGGLYVADGAVNLTDVTLSSNSVSGGAGGNGNGAFPGNGGDGGQAFGGALRFAYGTVAVRNSAVMDNAAQGGAAGVKGSSSGSINGSPGPGQGGGIHIDMAQVGLDEFTQDHVTSNVASTSHPNIYGPYNFLPNQLPGDYNEDGTVDAADYVVWRKTDGTQTGYDTWRANFGATLGSGAGATAGLPSSAVPEPTTCVLLCWCVASGWRLQIGRKQLAIDSATDN